MIDRDASDGARSGRCASATGSGCPEERRGAWLGRAIPRGPAPSQSVGANSMPPVVLDRLLLQRVRSTSGPPSAYGRRADSVQSSAMSGKPPSPTFAEISLLGASHAACSGAAFELQDAARESEVVALDAWEAEVLEGQRIIVVRGGSEGNYDDAVSAGLAMRRRRSILCRCAAATTS